MKTKALIFGMIVSVLVSLIFTGRSAREVQAAVSPRAIAANRALTPDACEPEIEPIPPWTKDLQPKCEPTDLQDLKSFIDAYFAEQMAARHVPGATFVLVKDGEILLAKGYGFADLEKQLPYSPDDTVFWAASVAKIFTMVGVLQLKEQGLIQLDDDVNRYLVDFQIPDSYPQPVTFKHLLTHTDGFEARIIGDAARSPEDLRALRTVVSDNLPARIAPPGEFLTYGNYGTNLAGVLVETVSGLRFQDYMNTRIFRPLEMRRTTFEQVLPADWMSELAIGYGYDGSAYEAKPFVYVNSLPQGGGRSTAIDMAHFMIALLQGGRYEDRQILNDDSVQLMFQQQYCANPKLSGITDGLFEIYGNGQRLLIRDGDGWGFRSRMVLIPEEKLGFFVNYNNEDADILREDLVSQFLDHYFPTAAQEPLIFRPEFLNQTDEFAGIYRPVQADETTFFKIALLFAQQIQVRDGEDGTLFIEPVGMGDSYGGFEGRSRWVEAEPLFFQRIDGRGSLAFGRDEDGQIAYLFSGQKYHGTYSKIAWYETPGLQMALLAIAASFFLGTLLAWPIVVWKKRRRGAAEPSKLPRLAGWLAWMVCGLHVLFIAAVTMVMTNFVEVIYGVPTLLQVALVLPLIAAVLMAVQLGMTVLAWKDTCNTLGWRVSYTLLTLTGLVFFWWLKYWNLLGYRS